MKGSMVMTQEVNVRELKNKPICSSTSLNSKSPPKALAVYSNIRTRRMAGCGLSVRERVTSFKSKPPKTSQAVLAKDVVSRPTPPPHIITEKEIDTHRTQEDEELVFADPATLHPPPPKDLANRAPFYQVPSSPNASSHDTFRGVLSAKKVELWLIRHGETEANCRRVTQGQQAGRLTRLGSQQAACLGGRLSREQMYIDAVLSSDLLRCRQTAYLATRDWIGTERPFFLDTNLRERSVGAYEGQHHSSPRPRRPQGISPRQYRAPSGESWQDVYRRAATLLHRTAATLLNPQSDREVTRILVFTHGGFIAETLNAATRTDEIQGAPLTQNGAINTSIYKLRLESTSTSSSGTPHKAIRGSVAADHSWTILATNDASHLARFRIPNSTAQSPPNFDIMHDHPPLPPTASSAPWWSKTLKGAA